MFAGPVAIEALAKAAKEYRSSSHDSETAQQLHNAETDIQNRSGVGRKGEIVCDDDGDPACKYTRNLQYCYGKLYCKGRKNVENTPEKCDV